MSAFIVPKAHISAILRGAMAHSRDFSYYHGNKYRGQLTGGDLDKVGQMLLDENIWSVRYRYPTEEGQDPDNLPGLTDREWKQPFSWDPSGRVPSVIETIKLIRCLDYQSCEHPGWETSEAHSFCESLILALINVLPGYEQAAWEWRE